MAHRGNPLHPDAVAGRNKKLSAGVRFSCLISGEQEGEWDCTCDDRTRNLRNCRNRRRLKHPILQGKREWLQVSSTLRPIEKIGDIKFFECPVSAITSRTWQIMRLVNQTTGGEHTEIHASIPILDQPPWYLQAVQIVRTERAEHRRREMEKRKPDG